MTARLARLSPRLLLPLALVLPGCANAPAPAAPRAAPAAPAEAQATAGHRTVTHSGRWAIVFSTRPDPVPLNEPFEMLVSVSEALGGAPPRVGVELAVDAGMPQHRHGMNRLPLLSRLADGRYLVEGLLFHMAGEWTVTFDVTLDGLTERAEVVLEVP